MIFKKTFYILYSSSSNNVSFKTSLFYTDTQWPSGVACGQSFASTKDWSHLHDRLISHNARERNIYHFYRRAIFTRGLRGIGVSGHNNEPFCPRMKFMVAEWVESPRTGPVNPPARDTIYHGRVCTTFFFILCVFCVVGNQGADVRQIRMYTPSISATLQYLTNCS